MLKIKLIIISIIIICFFRSPIEVETAKILAISGLPQPNKYAAIISILNGLNEKGHQITLVIRNTKHAQLHENIRQILIRENEEIYKEFLAFSTSILDKSFFKNLQSLFRKGIFITADIINNPSVKEIMQHEQFDLIIFETFMVEALYGLGEYFNAPMVGMSSFGTTTALDALVGNISPISFIPTLFIQHLFDVTFWHRCLNVALNVVDRMIFDILYLPHQRRLYEEHFPNATLTFEQVNRNFSLVLVNQHFSLNFPRPYVPNMIEMAGVHIDSKLELLPLNVQYFLDNSPQGVIYFYWGEQTFNVDLNISALLLNLFKNLNFKVIFNIDNKPPQEKQQYKHILQISNTSHHSILAHPNVKLSIITGDLLNVIDTVYFAKPVLGIPTIAHQHFNINMAIKMGYGLGLKLQQLNETMLKNTILELLNNPLYTQKVKELSRVFRDQPMTPKETVLFWIEYVLRHDGALHLRNKGRFLNFWQFYNVDVILAFTGAFGLIVFCIWILMKCMYFLWCRSKINLQIKVKSN
ncbi:UDP-glycosyltransferase UGT4-like [Lucilia sericata]|uniref:UDP-glycosyltransferase UGT4-like n=1 Tax=Lucilia sericata TaxID=13632 RepID=UPI0018A85AD5|nr:UDP-glycosyltransferase UGT4-like [Lucilia sericata]